MKIGLVRHFKVDHPYPARWLVGYDDVVAWFAAYDEAPLLPYAATRPAAGQWATCYCSPTLRARLTAQALFAGEARVAEALAELHVLPLVGRRWRLPFLGWAVVVRNKSFAPNPITERFQRELAAFLDRLEAAGDDVLLVSHALTMIYLQKALRRRGFGGKGFGRPENGKLYVYERA